MAEDSTTPLHGIADPASNDLLICGPGATIRETLARIERASPNLFQVVLDNERRVLGTVTDGDIRRAMLASMDLEEAVSRCMNTSPRVAKQTEVDKGSKQTDIIRFRLVWAG